MQAAMDQDEHTMNYSVSFVACNIVEVSSAVNIFAFNIIDWIILC